MKTVSHYAFGAFSLLLVLFTNSPIFCQSESISSLYSQLYQAKDDTTQLRIYAKLIDYFSYQPSSDSAEKYINVGLAKCKLISNKKYEARFCSQIGIYYRKLRKYKESEYYYQRGISVITDDKDITKNNIRYNLGLLYTTTGDFQKALNMYLSILHSFNYDEKLYDLGGVYQKIGVIYYLFSDHDLALKYFNKAIVISEKQNDQRLLINGLEGIASILVAKKKYNEALVYFNKAYILAKQNNYLVKEINCLVNIGECHSYLGNTSKAIEFLTQGLEKRVLSREKDAIDFCHIKLAQCYVRNNDLIEALKHLQSASSVIQPLYKMELLGTYKEYYEAQKNYKKALFFLLKEESISDSLLNIENKKQLDNSRNRYETTQEQMSLNILNKKLHLKTLLLTEQIKRNTLLEIQNQNISLRTESLFRTQKVQTKKLSVYKNEYNKGKSTIAHQQKMLLILDRERTFIIISISIFLSLCLSAFVSYRKFKKISTTLQYAYHTVEHQHDELLKISEFQDTIFSTLSFDLRPPLIAVGNELSAFMRDIPLFDEQKVKFYTLQEKVNVLYDTLDRLLIWSKRQSQEKNNNVVLQPVYLSITIQKVLQLLDVSIQKKSITIINSLNSDVKVLADPDRMEIIIRNIISNAIKFTPIGGTISFNFKLSDTTCRLYIKDTGIGVGKAELLQIFTSANSRIGTLGEKGNGLGLYICKELAESQGGKIYIESEVNVGTLVCIELNKC
ncbi:tetratricopeptide repeat protein [Emticicia sp. ODNR4P]|nr:tetratricopeptide repeat protein [Emticicia sp. ODNR4P]